jgi:hypothetical protein
MKGPQVIPIIYISPITGSEWDVTFDYDDHFVKYCYLNGRKIHLTKRAEQILYDLFNKLKLFP